ncbi:hypothetical protein AAFF_G00250400 [Aldrovandia affinis]|uniref:Immunoglobulin domain-containing protein n=1 Tax=Aldrovandia affinis TaxID=143900 RepID=A0AAD7RCS9_9TELE|nr:hypothetical protein AAFF_G00250400 [Aldrovandia affinis]
MHRGLYRRGRSSVQCLFLLCLADFSAPSSPPLYVFSHVGHEVTLPCNWTSRMVVSPRPQSPYLQWHTPKGSVFEMKGEARYEGRGYKGRVQVAPWRFEGGDCSLLLRELRFSDAALYESFVIVEGSMRLFIGAVRLVVRDHKYRQQLREGEPLVLKLHTPQAATVIFQGGNATESEVIWQKNSRDRSQGRLTKGDRILTLSGVRLEDSGIYKVLDPQGLAVSTVNLKVEGGREAHSRACRASITSLVMAASLLFSHPHVLF